MTTVLTIRVATLKAALTHAAKKDIRTSLCGVHVNLATGHVVATDGSRMIVIRDDGALAAEVPDFTIPRELVALALKGAGRAATLDVAFTPAPTADSPLAGTVKIGAVSGQVIDTKYPEWQRLIPRSVPYDTPFGERAALINPQFMADAWDALGILAGDRAGHTTPCAIHYTGADTPCIVTRDAIDALVIVMPLRREAQPTGYAEALARVMPTNESATS